MIEDLESMMKAHNMDAKGHKLRNPGANAKKIEELEKRVEKLENIIKGLVLINEYKRRSDGFYPSDVEVEYMSLIRKIEEDFQIQRRNNVSN